MTLPPDDRNYRGNDRGEEDRPDLDRPFDRPHMEFGRPRLDEPLPQDDFDDEDYDSDEVVEDFDDEPGTDDDFEGDRFRSESGRGAPNPLRLDPPLFAPVVFDDNDPPRRGFGRGGRGGDGAGGGPGGGRGRYESDAGLLRVLALIGVLGVVILALVLPFSPLSVLGDNDSSTPSGISASVSDVMPPLPEGLVALSRLYVITVEEGIAGPLSVGVELTESGGDGANLAYYAWDGATWSRVGSVQLAAGGGSVTGSIPAQSTSIAVLRRTALAHTMAMIVGPGETPDPAGLTAASLIVVTGAGLAGDGAVEADAAVLRSAQQVAGDRPVYLGVSGDAAAAGVFASTAEASAHVSDLLAMAETQGAAGLYVEYTGVSDAAGFTAFATSLAQQLQAADRRLIVGVPSEGAMYDWPGLLAVVDGLWVQAPLNPVEYHRVVGTILSGRGVTDASKVSIILDRRSAIMAGDGTVAPISLVEGLTIASTVDFNVDAIAAGRPVTMRTAYLGGGADQQLHWADDARAVTFTFTNNEEDSTVWFQNQYSFGFALHAAGQAGFGGVAVRASAAGGSHPDVWQALAAFVEEGSVALLRPYGPYLTPCWQAPDGAIEGQPECWTSETDTTAIVWRAPEQTGAYTVRLVVSEGTMFVGQEVVLRVGTAGADEVEATPEPTPQPIEQATPEPTAEPTPEPTPEPTAEPTPEPTPEPTATAAPTSTAGPPGPGGN